MAFASAQARARTRPGRLTAGEATLMLRGAAAARAIVTRLGPTERSWALAEAASRLERTAFARLTWTPEA